VSLLDDVTARGAEIRDRLWDLLERHAYPDDERSTWVEGSLAVALEHHEAISLLIKRQLNGSAFALVRPMVDTVVRAHWINAVANDDQVEQARQDNKNVFPSMSQMSEAVGKAYGADELFFAGKMETKVSGNIALNIHRSFVTGNLMEAVFDCAKTIFHGLVCSGSFVRMH
jgi:hypothetical protein